jgi:hypothetical protein
LHARLTALLAAAALLWTLFAPPPARATPEPVGERAPHEIAAGNECAGAVPSPPERRRLATEGAQQTLGEIADVAGDVRARRSVASVSGGGAPTLARWRLAHGTATSNP